ncbi:hypothetical protein CTI12_AA414490 [Artemisia annua]|uniref:Uncharacterized protein n=1 Tax=Artemisia annua TaxID=35608 RepID=A0A2U1M688_ARTAN|nr:hypothetical protein CTI12_AA414490 [Artemisia annua]
MEIVKSQNCSQGFIEQSASADSVKECEEMKPSYENCFGTLKSFLGDSCTHVLERKLRSRIRRNVSCYGRFMHRMVVIPPGREFNHIIPHDGDMDGESEGTEDRQASPDPLHLLGQRFIIMRFFTNPRKPMILALARPDPKRNLTTLVKAFGECCPLSSSHL